ncbi:MAG: acetate--CoA ligase [Bdellovibrionales bacterium]|nr:acetate--CoA ligase [Bdellovibrionales bacterium]
MTKENTLEHILNESRCFPPPTQFAVTSNMSPDQYNQMCALAQRDPNSFWAEQASSLHWSTPFNEVLNWRAPYAQWFCGGKLNVSYNCLDRFVEGGLGEKCALIWEGEPNGETKQISYSELLKSVCQLANTLIDLGIEPNDRVVIYMPMVPEAVVSMLACARIGAIHSVVFGGFSAEAIHDRLIDSSAKLIITADGGYRRGKIIPLKENVDKAIELGNTSVSNILVLRRTGEKISFQENRDLWWHDSVLKQNTTHVAQPFESEHPLFTLYTSGTTGKPKGILHTSGGYLTQTCFSAKLVFDLKPNDIYWCTADVGWITGHSYIVYGLLSNASTVVLYEGSPDYPDKDRFWEIIERHKVSIFYTAPTAIRSFMRWGDQYPNRHNLSSLRLLGTVGEPINPESWIWYHSIIGQEKCPIVDTWWQTETGSIMIAPVPGVVATKPGSATRALPGIDAVILDSEGNECKPDEGGYLAIRRPWPSMARGIFNDPKRFEETYWSKFPGIYFAGDGARKDPDGYFWIMGRVDDVVNISGHRLGTAEVESALVSHPAIAEAAVVGIPDEIKGQAIVAFVSLVGDVKQEKTHPDLFAKHVVNKIGALARPKQIVITPSLPKTRSGKIMRRLLRQIAAGETISGDTSTLEDVAAIKEIELLTKNASA